MCLVPTTLPFWKLDYTFYHYIAASSSPQKIFLRHNHPVPAYICLSVFIFAKRYAKQYTTASLWLRRKNIPAHTHYRHSPWGRKPHIFKSQNRKAYRYKLCFRRAVYEQALKGIISNLLSQSVYSKYCQEDESVYVFVCKLCIIIIIKPY